MVTKYASAEMPSKCFCPQVHALGAPFMRRLKTNFSSNMRGVSNLEVNPFFAVCTSPYRCQYQ